MILVQDLDYHPDPILIQRICLKLLQEDCLGQRSNPYFCVDEPDYNPDQGSGLP